MLYMVTKNYSTQAGRELWAAAAEASAKVATWPDWKKGISSVITMQDLLKALNEEIEERVHRHMRHCKRGCWWCGSGDSVSREEMYRQQQISRIVTSLFDLADGKYKYDDSDY